MEHEASDLIDRLDAAAGSAAGVVVVLSANPMHDTGGGQRSAQMALELLRRDFAVVFVSHGKVTETRDLGLRYDQPRLIEVALRDVGEAFVDRLAAIGGDGPRLVVTQVPIDRWTPLASRWAEAGYRTIYDCIDRWDSELGRGWYRESAERATARSSDVLVASAPVLCEHVERLTGRPCTSLPNAYNATVFDSAAVHERPADLPDGDVTLYVGALWGGWMEWGRVRACAEAHPDRAFVFVGDHRGEGRGLPRNCHFLGLKAQTDLPPYLAHADLAFLPWSTDEVTHATSPLKVYEFIGMGLPVVAPDLEPLRGLPGVATCPTEAQFVAAAGGPGRGALSSEIRAEMERFSARNSWSARIDTLLEAVQEVEPGVPGVDRTVVTSPARPRPRSGAEISVVIPAYNHEAYIGRALDSVRGQSFRAGELVIVDDGSTDDTASVIERHAWSDVRLIRQENRGAHRALNRAIGLARGQWVAILNSDDEYEPEWLEHAWAVARANGAALVCGAVTPIDEHGDPPDPAHPIVTWHAEMEAWARSTPDLRRALRRHNVAVTTSNFFMHRALWDRLGGFAAYRYVHDYDFLLRAVELCGTSVVHAPDVRGVRYRVHGGNTISESDRRAAREREEMKAALGGVGRRVRAWASRGRDRNAVQAAVRAGGTLSPFVSAGTSVPGGADTNLPHVGIVVSGLGTGGLEQVVGLLAQGMDELGATVSVLSSGGGGVVADALRSVDIDVRLVGGGDREIDRWVRERGVEVASTHFADETTVRALHATGVPTVETIQNTYAWFGPDDWARERRKAELLTHTIAVSDTVREYYERHTGRRPDDVVPNAVHPGRLARVPADHARRHLDLPLSSAIAVSVGRITEQKNPAGLLRAWRRVVDRNPDATLLLVGPTESSAGVRRLRREHASLFDRGHVRLVPAVPDVGLVLSAADVFVSNSFYEGWSVAASEAAWVGLPLVLSETGGARELVGDDGARGVVVPNPCGVPLEVERSTVASPDAVHAAANEEAFAEAVLEVLEARMAWKERTEATRAWARASVSPAVIASRYADILRALVADRA